MLIALVVPYNYQSEFKKQDASMTGAASGRNDAF